jgi:hypothetical protein
MTTQSRLEFDVDPDNPAPTGLVLIPDIGVIFDGLNVNYSRLSRILGLCRFDDYSQLELAVLNPILGSPSMLDAASAAMSLCVILGTYAKMGGRASKLKHRSEGIYVEHARTAGHEPVLGVLVLDYYPSNLAQAMTDQLGSDIPPDTTVHRLEQIFASGRTRHQPGTAPLVIVRPNPMATHEFSARGFHRSTAAY